MDDFLAELYGTTETINAGGEDLEKQAAAEFLVKMAQDEGIDLNQLSDDEVGALLYEVEKSAAAGEFGGYAVEDEAQEKLAEADFLGRAMAHAYVNELSEIEKQALDIKGGAKRAVGWVGDKLQALGGRVARVSGAASRNIQGAGKKAYEGQLASRAEGLGGMDKVRRAMHALKQPNAGGLKKRDARIARALRSEATAAGGKAMASRQKLIGGATAGGAVALTGGAGYGGYKALGGGSEKKSYNEAIEEAASERALEMLAEAGYDVEKVAEADVETRALQILEASGYPVNWS